MGNFIVWNDQFSVKVARFDNEHRTIIGIINRVHGQRLQAQTPEMLQRVFSDLLDYAMTHFAHEEKLMAAHQYPDWKRHRLEHRVFVKKITDFKQSFLLRKTSNMDPLFSYLKEWWLHHIQVEDKKYGAFFNSKGVS